MFAEVGESRIYYERYGEGPPLVLAHGVGGNHTGWFNQIAAFRDRYEVVVWDHRGFGRSTDVEDLGRAGFASDLSAVMGIIGSPAVLVGQSMGAGACIGYACANPEQVKGIVFADSLIGLALPPDLAAQMNDSKAENEKLSQVERVLGASTRRTAPEKAVLYSQLAGFNRYALRTLHGEQESFALDVFQSLNIPSLFIVGDEDILFPPSIVRALQMRLSNSSFAEIPRAGHSAYFEAPEKFNAALTEWLQKIGF